MRLAFLSDDSIFRSTFLLGCGRSIRFACKVFMFIVCLSEWQCFFCFLIVDYTKDDIYSLNNLKSKARFSFVMLYIDYGLFYSVHLLQIKKKKKKNIRFQFEFELNAMHQITNRFGKFLCIQGRE